MVKFRMIIISVTLLLISLMTACNHWKQIVYDDNNPVFTLVSIAKDGLNIRAYAIKDSVVVLIDSFAIQ